MAQAEQSRTSRSLAIYGLLLELYPRPYLQRHRAEMLQNFQDLEEESPSRAGLWLFLAVSLRSQFIKTLWGQTAIVVIVLAVLLACTERHAVAREHPVEGFCCGYILGRFAGWVGERWQASAVSRVPKGQWPSTILRTAAQSIHPKNLEFEDIDADRRSAAGISWSLLSSTTSWAGWPSVSAEFLSVAILLII